MYWREDVESGDLLGLDYFGRVRLDKNNGVLLPYANLPITELDAYYYTQTALDGGALDTRYYTEDEIDDIIDDIEAGIIIGPHNSTLDKQGGTTDQYYHLTAAQHTDLTDGNDCASHKHDNYYYTESEVDSALSGKSDVGHTHDERYYTETELGSGSITLSLNELSLAGNLIVDTNVLYVDTTNDSVGIGKASPTHNLEVSKDSSGAYVDLLVINTNLTSGTANSRIMSYVGGESSGNPKIGVGITGVRDYFWYIDNSDNDKLRLSTNDVDIITIDTDGNVGIGTIVSDRKLEINDPDGECLRLTYNDNNGSATYYADFSVSSAGNLTITPVGDLVFNPTGNDVIYTWGAGKSLSSSDYVSQTTGWGISYGSSGGHADFRSMYADELHVQAFIADIYQASVGAIIVTKSRAKLSRNFVIPDNGNTGTLYLEDLEGWEGVQLFEDNDIIRLRHIDYSGGGLVVTDVWGFVVDYVDEGGGEQSYTFETTDEGGVLNETIFAGAIALDYGNISSGSRGVWEATVLDAAGAPYSQVKTWATNPWTGGNWTVRTRLGNLDGISGVGLEYGLYAYKDTYQYLLLSDAHFEVHGVDFKLYDSTTNTVRLDPATPSFAMGADLPTGFSTNDGIWMGKDTVYKFRVGDADGERFAWDGSDLFLYANNYNYLKFTGTSIEFYGGASSATKVMELTNTPSITIGETGADKSYVYISSGAVQLKNNTTTKLSLDADGDIILSGDIIADSGNFYTDDPADEGQRVEILGTGKIKFYDSTNAVKLEIGNSIYSSYPGLVFWGDAVIASRSILVDNYVVIYNDKIVVSNGFDSSLFIKPDRFEVTVYQKTLSADETLTTSSKMIQLFKSGGGSARDIVLPAEGDSTNLCFFISCNGFTGTVKNDGSTTIRILTNEGAWFFCDGTDWYD